MNSGGPLPSSSTRVACDTCGDRVLFIITEVSIFWRYTGCLKIDTSVMMKSTRSPHVSQATRVDDEGSGPPEFMCHMWMRQCPPT
jgi:hypothetical protein